MLSYKRWSPDSLLRLLLLLFVALGTAGVVGAAADRFWTTVPDETRRFWVAFGSGTVMQLAGLVLFAWFLGENQMSWREGFGLRREETGRMIVIGVVTAVIGLVLAITIMWISLGIMTLVEITPVPQTSIEALQQSDDPAQRLAIAVTAIGLAPVFEEMLFRGLLYPAVKQAGFPRLAFWGTAVLFGLSHVNLLAFASLTCFGLVLAVLYERTDNLLAPMTAHTVFNAGNYVWVVFSAPPG